MATQTGTASSYLDLLAQFHTFVTGLSGGMAWTALRTAAPEYIWSAPGSLGSPADPLIIGAKPFSNVPADYYNWRLGGFLSYDPALAFEAQAGYVNAAGTSSPVLNLWNASIPYRFYATGRRAIILAQVSTVYVVCYLGYLSTYVAPGAFPYPLLVGGSMAWDVVPEPVATDARWRWSYNGNEIANFPICSGALLNPYGSQLRMRKPDGSWPGFKPSVVSPPGAAVGKIWPYGNFGNDQAANWQTNLDGTYTLLPIVLHDSTPNVYGELDGIFAVTGFGNGAGNILTVAGVNYFVVPNVFRTTQQSYFAIREN